MSIYPRIAALVFGAPLAIEPGAFRTMLDAIGPRLLGVEEASADGPHAEVEADPGADRRAALHQRLAAVTDGEVVDVGDGMAEYSLTAGGVAVIPIQGTLVNRFDWLSASCGISSYDSIGMALDAALADPNVKAILLDVDSPGGQAYGVSDLADRIRAATLAKPVWAAVNPVAFSAAYWLASAASRVTLPKLGDVGSVGALRVHVDRSQANANRGLAYTAVHSGARKVDGASHAPLSTDARDAWQADVDQVRQQFAAAVAAYRGLTVDAVLATEAGTYMDAAAVAAGLADAVMTFDDALAALTNQVNQPAAPSSQAFQRGFSSPAARATGHQEVTMADSQMAAEGSGATSTNAGPAPAAPATPAEGDIRAAAQAYAKEVSDLCLLAGRPEAAAEFMAAGLSVEQVRGALIEASATNTAAASVATQRPADGTATDNGWRGAYERRGAFGVRR